MSAWIKMVSDEEADENLQEVLNLARTPHGTVDNVMRVHSLRPNTMRGHVVLYRAALHDDANTIPMWLQETISSYVSILNNCPYSLANHWANARHLIGDAARADRIEAALHADRPEDEFEGAELSLMRYARKMTKSPGEMVEADVADMRAEGLDDGQILEGESDYWVLQLRKPSFERFGGDDRWRHRRLLQIGLKPVKARLGEQR